MDQVRQELSTRYVTRAVVVDVGDRTGDLSARELWRCLRGITYSKYSIDPIKVVSAALVMTSLAARSASNSAASLFFLECPALQAVKAPRPNDSPNEGMMYVCVW